MYLRTIPVAALLAVLAVSAHADPASDTVPTAQLFASFGVSGGADGAEAFVALFQKTTAPNGSDQYTELALSPDEKVMFSQGDVSIAYDPSDGAANALPYFAGGTYRVTFIRFDGETFTSQATMPEPVALSKPAPGSVFQKSEVVDLAWNAVPADLVVTVLLTMCGHPAGDITYSDAGEEIPAGFVAGCPGEIANAFGVAYAKGGSAFAGLVGGFSAASEATVNFTYAAESLRLDSPGLATRLEHDLFRAITQARRDRLSVVHILKTVE